MKKQVIIAAGGTGGHLYPGIAIARVLRDRNIDVTFVVRINDPGREVLTAEKFAFREISTRGIPRRASEMFSFIVHLAQGIFSANKVVREIKPVMVFGMGGYVSFPVVLMAKLNGFKTVIHEQNCLPGRTNRLLSTIADKIAISFECTKRYFHKDKLVFTGNPVRQELFTCNYSDSMNKLGIKENLFTVLIFGGSQGAMKLNRTVIEAWDHLKAYEGKIQFVLLSGKKDFDWVDAEYKKKNIPGKAFAYLNDICLAYEAADLLIARSGAMTVSELMILNKPCILVPFPFATHNHQEFNARVLEKNGKAKVILEKDLDPKMLAAEIGRALKDFSGHKKDYKVPEVLPQNILADLVP